MSIAKHQCVFFITTRENANEIEAQIKKKLEEKTEALWVSSRDIRNCQFLSESGFEASTFVVFDVELLDPKLLENPQALEQFDGDLSAVAFKNKPTVVILPRDKEAGAKIEIIARRLQKYSPIVILSSETARTARNLVNDVVKAFSENFA